jgi:hypothetical protein
MASATPCQRVRVRRLRSLVGLLTSAGTVDVCTSESRVGSTCASASSTEYAVQGGAQATSRESVGPMADKTNILALIPGEFISRASRTLPDARARLR